MQEFSDILAHCLHTPFFDTNLATPAPYFVYLMVHKQVHRKLGGVRDHPGSSWGSGHTGYSEQSPVLISQVRVGSSWLCAPALHGASCREAAGSCDCTVFLAGGNREKKAAGGYTVMTAAAFSSQLVSVDCYPHPSLENLCEKVYRMSVISSYKLVGKFFKPPIEFRIYYNLHFFSLKS